MGRKLWTVAGVIGLTITGAEAADYGGEFGLGHLATDGNTQVRTITGKVALDVEGPPWKNSFLATSMNASSSGDGSETAERYAVSNKLDRNFAHDNYAFAVVEFERDLAGANRQRISEAVGYGYHLLTGPTHILDLEIGAGARQTTANVTNERENEAIGRFSGKYKWKISEFSNLSQTLKMEPGESNTYSESVTELKLPIIGNLSTGLSYTVRNNTVVPPGVEKTDTATAINFTYDFGKD